MGTQKKVWSVEVKEQAVLRLLSGEAPGKLAKEYGFAENLLYKWLAAFLEGCQQGLKGKVASPSASLEAENGRLLAEKEIDPLWYSAA